MMASSLSWAERPLPRPVRYVGLPIAFVLLTLFFIFLGFPYDRIEENLTAQIREATGSEVEIESLGPHLGLLGPGLEARGVTAYPPGIRPISFERVVLRPAWSLAWLRADPAIHLDLVSPLGSASGAVILGSERGFDGRVQNLDLAALPLEAWLGGGRVDGRLAADADLLMGLEGPGGSLEFEVTDGSVSLPNLPIGLPFERLSGELRFGDETYLSVDRLELEGPILTARVSGALGEGGRGGIRSAPLDLQVEVDVKGSAIRTTLRGLGVRLDRDGTASFGVAGTLSNPVLD
jgi:type II secretion system protein N